MPTRKRTVVRQQEADTPPDAETLMGDNFLKSAVAEIVEAFGRTKEANRTTLETHRDIGFKLLECREALGTKRKFNVWVEAQNLPFSRAWRNRLIQLATYWNEIMAAVDTISEDQRKWSVDGIIKIWSDNKKSADRLTKERRTGSQGAVGGNSSTFLRKRIADLEAQLVKALMETSSQTTENIVLREEIRVLRIIRPAKKIDIDRKTKDLASKVNETYLRPGTPEEGTVALGRLKAMAKSRDIPFYDFASACELRV